MALADLQHARRPAARRGRSSSSAPSASPSSLHAALGQQPPRLRARPAERRRRSARAGGRAVRRPSTVELLDLLGRLALDETRSKCASAAARGLGAVEALDERARERALGVARAGAGGRRLAEQQLVPRAIASSGRLSVLPYISSGGSVTPMWLPSDFDIFSLAVDARRGSAS